MFNTFFVKKSSLAKNLCYSFSSFLLLLAKKIQRTNRLRILCKKRVASWLNSEHKGGYILCGLLRVEGTSTWLFKVNKGGYILCGFLLVKDFTRLLEISRTVGCLGTAHRHGLWPNQYKSCVFFLLPYTLYFSVAHFFISALLLVKLFFLFFTFL